MDYPEMSMEESTDSRCETGMEGRILEAAEKLFLQTGYQRTSTTRIAREAGCNQALVHYYFRTKERLFAAVMGGKIGGILKKFISPETGEGTFEERLGSLIERHYDAIRENSNVVLFLIEGFTVNPELFEDIVSEAGTVATQALEALKESLESEIEAGRIRPVSVQQLILNIISLNAFLFAVKPLFARVWGFGDGELNAFLDERRGEVVKSVMLSLRP